jgi:hypothetical protein
MASWMNKFYMDDVQWKLPQLLPSYEKVWFVGQSVGPYNKVGPKSSTLRIRVIIFIVINNLQIENLF